MALISSPEIFEYSIQAKDDTLGKVKDLYFDRYAWDVRYLVVDTGKWLPGKRVLVSPHSVKRWDKDNDLLVTDLTTQGVRDCPSVSAELPLSWKEEQEMARHFGWPYDEVTAKKTPFDVTTGVHFFPTGLGHYTQPRRKTVDSELQSVAKLENYEVYAKGQKAGFIHGIVVNPEDFTVPYVLVDMGNWFSPDIVTIPTALVEFLDDLRQRVRLALTAETMEEAPRIPTQNLQGIREEQLLRYFAGDPGGRFSRTAAQ